MAVRRGTVRARRTQQIRTAYANLLHAEQAKEKAKTGPAWQQAHRHHAEAWATFQRFPEHERERAIPATGDEWRELNSIGIVDGIWLNKIKTSEALAKRYAIPEPIAKQIV